LSARSKTEMRKKEVASALNLSRTRSTSSDHASGATAKIFWESFASAKQSAIVMMSACKRIEDSTRISVLQTKIRSFQLSQWIDLRMLEMESLGLLTWETLATSIVACSVLVIL
jgi:propanediol dehydratase small subunit